MMRPSLLITFGSLVTALLIGSIGCSSTAPSTSLEAVSQDPRELEGAWSLLAIEGEPVTASPQQRRPTLRFDPEATRVSGFAGVNQFGGAYEAAAGALTFAPLIMTKMAGPPVQMDLERRYSRALEATTGWRLDGGHLELLADGRVVARFAREE